MKKVYFVPVIDSILFDEEDVIRTSQNDILIGNGDFGEPIFGDMPTNGPSVFGN